MEAFDPLPPGVQRALLNLLDHDPWLAAGWRERVRRAEADLIPEAFRARMSCVGGVTLDVAGKLAQEVAR